jgi:RNA ligase
MTPTLNKQVFDDYVNSGRLKSQTHPKLPLTIYNYSEQTQFSREWDDITKQSRGLVLDDKGRVVIRCMKKFFNHNEPESEASRPTNESYRIFEKMDGSLIEIVNDAEHGVVVASRGSFASDQALMAASLFDPAKIEVGYSYIFELIHPDNTIVVHYGLRQELVLLCIINTETGEEVTLKNDFEKPAEYSVADMEALMQKPNFEGVVLCYASGFREKMKTDEYVRLHRIVTGYNEKTIWEYLSTKTPLNLVQVPEEFTTWLDAVTKKLEDDFAELERVIQAKTNEVSGFADRKTQAQALADFQHRGAVFSELDGKSYDEYIWKLLKPKLESNIKKEENE